MRRFKDLKAFVGPRTGVQDTSALENETMFEGFEWYCPNDYSHWKRLQKITPELKAVGIDNIWIPPGCKAGWVNSNGYDVYDLYDLGEFDQKGSKCTKWGTKEELVSMMNVARESGVGVYWDGVLNHKAAADYTERCKAIKVDNTDRTKEVGHVHEVEVWTGYNFPGRGDKYSSMKWHWHHFSGTNYEARLQSSDSLYKFVGENKPGWSNDVDDEDGNADYLMFNDLDFLQKEVRDDVMQWGEWISRDIGLAGFRLDAVKHFSWNFLKAWIEHLDRRLGKKLFIVGEYWLGDTDVLARMVDRLEGRLHLFDVPLVGKFSELSKARHGDLRTIFHGTLVERYPNQAVTFVQNHDTQERFERDHAVDPIEPWFIPLAYAIILLRKDFGYPCVFYGDIYGTRGAKPHKPAGHGKIPIMIKARKLYAYGPQKDYLDEPDCIGFTRLGHASHCGGAGLAVIISSATSYRFKQMYVGEEHAGEEWIDVLGFAWGRVTIDKKGTGNFPVGPRSVGVWISGRASGMERLSKLRL